MGRFAFPFADSTPTTAADLAVTPRAVPGTLFSNTSTDCLVISPLSEAIRSTDTSHLSDDLQRLYRNLPQNRIARVTIGVDYSFCCPPDKAAQGHAGTTEANGQEDQQVCVPAENVTDHLNGVALPITVAAVSTAVPGDYDPSIGIVEQKQVSQLSLARATEVPHLQQGPLQLTAVEKRHPEPDVTCLIDCEQQPPTFTHTADFNEYSGYPLPAEVSQALLKPVAGGSEDANGTSNSLHTFYLAGAMVENSHLVYQEYYPVTLSDVIAACSGLLSLMLMILNCFFPKIEEVDQPAPNLVRVPHHMVRLMLYPSKEAIKETA
eukprot:g5504.t1